MSSAMLRMARVVRLLLLVACVVTAMTDAAGPKHLGGDARELRGPGSSSKQLEPR